ncbi:hypothetical protein HDU92_003771 [Lobulomyces angularis]|nr:hypothetical protein HDU92_003771 [Lobulomyces angularis]
MGCGASQLAVEEVEQTTTPNNNVSALEVKTKPTLTTENSTAASNNLNSNDVDTNKTASIVEVKPAVKIDNNDLFFNKDKIANEVSNDALKNNINLKSFKLDSSITIIAPSAEDFQDNEKNYKEFSNPLSNAVQSIGFNPVLTTTCYKVNVPLKPIAFEIPLDNKTKNYHRSRPPTRMLLPQLGLPVKTTASSNKDAHLKVDEYLNKVLDDGFDKPSPYQPFMASSLKLNSSFGKYQENSSLVLKKKLLEKEAQAAKNRQKEIEKLQAKLARQEQHAKLIRERKKLLKTSGNDVPNEEETVEKRGGAGFRSSKTINSSKIQGGFHNVNGKEVINDADSGIGSRTGSGRSDSRPNTSVLNTIPI